MSDAGHGLFKFACHHKTRNDTDLDILDPYHSPSSVKHDIGGSFLHRLDMWRQHTQRLEVTLEVNLLFQILVVPVGT